MRCRLIAALFLLSAAAIARAEYVVIVVNLNAPFELPKTQGPGGVGPVGEGGRASGQPGGMIGSPPGGMLGTPPSGMVGSPPGGMLGSPPSGMIGSPPGGMLGMGGFGGRPMTPPIPGMGGIGGATEDADENPSLVVAVVELTESPKSVERRLFEADKQPLIAKHRWGRAALYHKSSSLESVILKTASAKPLESMSKLFAAKFDDLQTKKFPIDKSIDVARWALQHNLVAGFEKVMDKAAETDKGHTLVASYLKVKEELAKPTGKGEMPAILKNKLFEGFKVAEADGHHYVILHQSSEPGDFKEQLGRLEKSFKSYYYWWAMRGILLPLPQNRMVAVLTERDEDFRKLQKNLTASPVVTDSFTTRSEGVSVFASKRRDAAYATLEASSKQFWDSGFIRSEVLKGTPTGGIPKGTKDVAQVLEARTRALLMKLMEEEWEATGMSHETARQLLYSSKLLPTNVHSPEWLQFGMASFFEVPLQSPFGGAGCVNPYWLQRFKQYNDPKAKPSGSPTTTTDLLGGLGLTLAAEPKATKYGVTPYETLVSVITDEYFRARPGERETAEAATRQARAAAWALAFYLTQPTQLPGLQKYFKELAKMPRDVELDGKALEVAFARAFDLVDPTTRMPDRNKMSNFARGWNSFIMNQKLESDAVHKTIGEFYAKMNRSMSTPPTAGGTPGTFPGLPGGTRPGGNGGGRPGGGRPGGGGGRPGGGGAGS